MVQAERGTCNKFSMRKFCNCSCGRCPDEDTEVETSAAMLVSGSSSADDSDDASIGEDSDDSDEDDQEEPTEKCVDIPPPWSAFSCEEQAKLEKCHRDWMRGYCLKSCGLCAVQGMQIFL